MGLRKLRFLQTLFSVDPRCIRAKEPIVESKHAIVAYKVLVMKIMEIGLFGDVFVGPREAKT